MGGENVKDHCGVFGIFNHPEAARMTYLGLFALQHRGEEAAGICSSNGDHLFLEKDMGLVGEVFTEARIANLKGSHAIGHTRYSTTGSSSRINAQPYCVDYSRGQVAIAHNGNLVNAQVLRAELEAYGSIFGSTTDSEIFIHLMAKPNYRTVEESVVESVSRVEGAFSVVMLSEKQLFAIRDPHGFRPLCLGRLGNGYVVASETCAFDLTGAEYLREIEPGEVLVIDDKGLRSFYPFKDQNKPRAHCIFEHVYFARPDSTVFGDNVAAARERMGRNLAKEHPAEADLVIPVPDSGNFAAAGYAHESGILLGHGFTRNHYIGRTFISPSESSRSIKVKIKLNPIREMIEGKRVVVVDDSIVRGNTARSRVALLRRAGAKEVHMRISCPPHLSPCYYGIDFPSKEELLACKMSLEEIKKFLDVDSLGYLSVEGMLAAASRGKSDYCAACFTGKYPTPIFDDVNKFKLEQKRC
ncbi:MAG: amidophosphoribosyltransferase [Candidatus Omnitrophica bacterium]|nr:amidophosphoribosyltransferase [Candidatus Omnitrophota bacterium]